MHYTLGVIKFSIGLQPPLGLLTIQKRKQKAIFFHRKFLKEKENKKSGPASDASGGVRGMGNPREISTRTCNGESAFLADGSDVDDESRVAAVK